jgi:hypothetical protein
MNKIFQLTIALFIAVLFTGCSAFIDDEPITDDKTKWNEFVKTFNEKLTAKGGYALLRYKKHNKTGYAMEVEMTNDTTSKEWVSYFVRKNRFVKGKDIELEISEGDQPYQFLYKPYQYDLNKVYDLVQHSKQKLKTEKNITDVQTALMTISIPTTRAVDDFENEFHVVIWQYCTAKDIYYTFSFNSKDSCDMMAELPKGFKL